MSDQLAPNKAAREPEVLRELNTLSNTVDGLHEVANNLISSLADVTHSSPTVAGQDAATQKDLVPLAHRIRTLRENIQDCCVKLESTRSCLEI